MSEGDSFGDVIARLRAGDEEAARQVFERYARALIGLARRRLDAVVAGKVEAEDVVQSVYKSFFWRFGEAQFDLDGWASLWKLLVVITMRKCSNQLQHYRRDCRAVAREVRAGADGDSSGAGWEAPGREPTPLEAAVLTETLESLFHKLKPQECEILALSLQGHSVQEISQQLDRRERTVRRLRERVRHQLERLQAEGSQ